MNAELRGADIRAADMVVLIWVFTWLPQVLPGESHGQVREGSCQKEEGIIITNQVMSTLQCSSGTGVFEKRADICSKLMTKTNTDISSLTF